MVDLLFELTGLADYLSFGPTARSISAPVRRKIIRKMTEVLVDPRPAESLRGSASVAPSFYSGISFGDEVSPLARWREIRQLRAFMPDRVRERTEKFFKRPQLPDWRSIQRLVRSAGFEALPVRGYTGGFLYLSMIEAKRLPVCTTWLTRPALGPRYLSVIDPMHDLGHAFAFMMPDYKKLLLKFARTVRLNSTRLNAKRVETGYLRFFEYAYALDPKRQIESIGAATMTFDWPRIVDGVAVIEPRATSSPKHRPFRSREEWREQAERLIAGLAR